MHTSPGRSRYLGQWRHQHLSPPNSLAHDHLKLEMQCRTSHDLQISESENQTNLVACWLRKRGAVDTSMNTTRRLSVSLRTVVSASRLVGAGFAPCHLESRTQTSVKAESSCSRTGGLALWDAEYTDGHCRVSGYDRSTVLRGLLCLRTRLCRSRKSPHVDANSNRPNRQRVQSADRPNLMVYIPVALVIISTRPSGA